MKCMSTKPRALCGRCTFCTLYTQVVYSVHSNRVHKIFHHVSGKVARTFLKIAKSLNNNRKEK